MKLVEQRPFPLPVMVFYGQTGIFILSPYARDWALLIQIQPAEALTVSR